MLDGGWGLLDGMNDAGLAGSLTFGGRFAQAPGVGIVIVLRYLLETCDTVAVPVPKVPRSASPRPRTSEMGLAQASCT